MRNGQIEPFWCRDYACDDFLVTGIEHWVLYVGKSVTRYSHMTFPQRLELFFIDWLSLMNEW